MNGLEYVLNLYQMQHIELADKLGIKKQNINMWVKGKQKIPKKHIGVLKEIFHLDEIYFMKELSEVDKLEIQKEKLKKDLKPFVKQIDHTFSIGEVNDFIKKPVYDKKEVNQIQTSIEKAKLVERFKEVIELSEEGLYLDTFKLIIELLEHSQQEVLFHKTIQALAHYFGVLPDWVSTGEEQDGFETEIFEVFDDNNY